MVKKRVRDPEELPDAPVHSAGEDNDNDSGSDVSFGFHLSGWMVWGDDLGDGLEDGLEG